MKRAHDEKSTETESSKAPMLVSPRMSPLAKKVRVDPSTDTTRSDLVKPLVAHGYSVDAEPSSFAHFLGDLLLPQSWRAILQKLLNQFWMILLGIHST